MNAAVSFFLVGATGLASVGAQAGYWSDGPAGFSNVHLTHDPGRHVFVFTGDRANDPSAREEVFEYDGTAVRSFHVLPAGDISMYCVYDPLRSYTALVSYVSGVGFRTWSWDGTALSLREAESALTSLAFDSNAADLVAGTALLHGRVTGGNACFAWDGATWHQLGTAPFPTERVVTHPQTGRPLLQFTLASPGQAWSWDGVGWQANPAAIAPAALLAAATDRQHNRVLGIEGAPGAVHSWNGTQWQLLPMSGLAPAASMSPRACALGDGIMLVDNGTGLRRLDLVPLTAGSFTALGAGCPGPTGTPLLAPAGGNMPRTGSSFVLQLSGLPSSPINRPFLFTGTNVSSWGGVPLPVDLGVFGMSGCTAWIAPDFTAVLVNQGGTAWATFAIPMGAPLVGARFFAQGAVLVPGFNAGSLVVSNAGAGLVGTP